MQVIFTRGNVKLECRVQNNYLRHTSCATSLIEGGKQSKPTPLNSKKRHIKSDPFYQVAFFDIFNYLLNIGLAT